MADLFAHPDHQFVADLPPKNNQAVRFNSNGCAGQGATARAFPMINQLKTGGTIVRQDGLRLFGFLQFQGSYPQDDLRAIAYFR